ncbi:MAG: prolipoprotein diacylglyceryl transferase [Fimbriimonadaceae bacterium]|nr:prolipoprotein diacylglyceryl transferase [Chitinophagales bacterium]
MTTDFILLRSYATLTDFISEVFGWDIPLPLQMFGFFVALAFLAGAYILVIELKRKARAGIFQSTPEKVIIGEPPKPLEIIFNAIFGFIIGFKFIAAIFNWKTFSENPQVFIFSKEGNIIGGILLAALFAYLKYREKKQQQLPKPQEKTIDVYPHHRIGDIVVIAAIAGIAGAKIFSNFEEPGGWKNFMEDPLGNFFSGLTIYGGLFLGAACVIWYAKRKKISVLHLGDAVAPALILAYGVGRIGCQVSGDGDWGIYNAAYISNANGEIEIATDSSFKNSLKQYPKYYMEDFEKFDEVPHANFKAPSFIPRSWVAQNYAHNVNDDGIPFKECDEPKCYFLPTPVFPTPIYEIIMCGIIFSILWFLRKKWKIPGMLFAFYIILTGVERYFIETIRVNNVLNFMGIEATQATFISVALILFGLGFMIVLKMRNSRIKTA